MIDQLTKIPPQEITNLSVKLYHPLKHAGCPHEGKSVTRQVSSIDESEIRVQIETGTDHIFRGENCCSCSERAVVTIL